MTTPAIALDQGRQKRWSWPINPLCYDQNPGLDDAESHALQVINHAIDARNNHWLQLVPREPALQRLLQPIHDVRALIRISPNQYPSLVSTLWKAMAVRQTTFWAWSDAEWLDVLNGTLLDEPYFQSHGKHATSSLVALAYLCCEFSQLRAVTSFQPGLLARKLFSADLCDQAFRRVSDMLTSWGYHLPIIRNFACAVDQVFLANRSPYLEDLTAESLDQIRREMLSPTYAHWAVTLSEALVGLKILDKPLDGLNRPSMPQHMGNMYAGIAETWVTWARRWCERTPLAPKSRERIFREIVMAGRWLAAQHPAITSPAQWTPELATEYVAAVTRATVGEWANTTTMLNKGKLGKPLAPRTKSCRLFSLRLFFRDCQQWQWIACTFNPAVYLATPRTIQSQIGPDPRVIRDDIWAKLLWAGLNVAEEDLPGFGTTGGAVARSPIYPLAFVRALAIVWLFGGLRQNEIRRLRVGCVRWQREDVCIPASNDILPKDAVCFLHIPVNKTGTAFTKPVDCAVGEAIAAWECIRPAQPAGVDPKTGEVVDFLFAYRGHPVGPDYINHSLIALLCRKAGVPIQHTRGTITSHWARSTIASQLYNAKEPMTLAELQAWLGHRTPNSTQQYVEVSPTRLAKAYADAAYFRRNTRTIDVLINQDAVVNGDAANGLPWKYYDLGHGYCTYDFFDQCEHRMACAQCAFYRPKNAFLELLLEKKMHLLHMRQDIPLTDLELAVVDGDLTATERLISQLNDVPTPAGPTARQLKEQRQTDPIKDERGAANVAEERRGEGGEGGAGEGVGA
jgi:integrase